MTDRATDFHALYGDLRIRDQRRYYKDRHEEYRAAHRQAIVLRNVLLVLAALAGAVGQSFSGAPRAALAVAAAVLAALAGMVVAYAALMGFPRLAKLYADAEAGLAEAEIDWHAGKPCDDLTATIDRVEEIFRKENGYWGQLVVEAESTRKGDGKPT